MSDFIVKNFHDRDGQVTNDKTNKNHQNHFGDFHFATFEFAPIRTVLSQSFMRLSDHPEYVGVAQHNDNWGYGKSNHKQGGFWRIPIGVWFNWTRSQSLIHTVNTPFTQQSRNLQSVAESPYQSYVNENFSFGVNFCVELRPSYQYIPENNIFFDY